MKKQKFLVSAFCGILIVGGLTGCSMAVTQSDTSAIGADLPQESDVSVSNLSVAAYDGTEDADISCEEQFKPYEQFGMTYNASKGELEYNGKSVRWFEDYYTIPDGGGQAGTDFFNENGVVDVYAVRDLNSFIRLDKMPLPGRHLQMPPNRTRRIHKIRTMRRQIRMNLYRRSRAFTLPRSSA